MKAFAKLLFFYYYTILFPIAVKAIIPACLGATNLWTFSSISLHVTNESHDCCHDRSFLDY